MLVGGAPEVQIDAVRYMSVHASGSTAVSVHKTLTDQYQLNDIDLLLSHQAASQQQVTCRTYRTRPELDKQVIDYLSHSPEAVIFMSAAINDYEFAALTIRKQQNTEYITSSEAKVSSGADELSIHLKPAAKLIDQLPSWGHRGPLFACKYEDASTVVESAQRLCLRVQATCVLANSICGAVQVLVDARDVVSYQDRPDVLASLSERIANAVHI